jgi:hypothetical protein
VDCTAGTGITMLGAGITVCSAPASRFARRRHHGLLGAGITVCSAPDCLSAQRLPHERDLSFSTALPFSPRRGHGLWSI